MFIGQSEGGTRETQPLPRFLFSRPARPVRPLQRPLFFRHRRVLMLRCVRFREKFPNYGRSSTRTLRRAPNETATVCRGKWIAFLLSTTTPSSLRTITRCHVVFIVIQITGTLHHVSAVLAVGRCRLSVYHSRVFFTLRASCGAVFCNRSCLFVCVRAFVGLLPG